MALKNRLFALATIAIFVIGTLGAAPAVKAAEAECLFKIDSLGTSPLYAVDSGFVGGDVEGGIGISDASVFVKSDHLARYNLTDFASDAVVEDEDDTWDYMIATDLATNTTWTFPEFDAGDEETSDTVYGLGIIESLDHITGDKTGEQVELSEEISVAYYNNDTDYQGGIFSGYGRIAIVDPQTGNVYDIRLPSGEVTVVATLDIDESPYFLNQGENEADWLTGVVEYHDNALHLVYSTMGDGTSDDPDTIERLNLETGVTETVFTAPEGTDDNGYHYLIGQDNSWIVDVSNDRWYLTYEYGDENDWISGQLGATVDYDEPLVALAAETMTGDCGGEDPSITPVDTRRLTATTSRFATEIGRAHV